MKRPQFSLRTILWLMLVVALLLGWWTDRKRLTGKLDEELQHRAVIETALQTQKGELEKYKSDKDAYKNAWRRSMQRSEPLSRRRSPATPDNRERTESP